MFAFKQNWTAMTQKVFQCVVGDLGTLQDMWTDNSNLGTTDYLQLMQAFSTIDICNTANFACDIKMYELMPRTATASSPITAWANGYAAYQFASGGSFVVPTQSNIGQGPSVSSEFNKLWKILKIKKMRLGAGGHYITSLCNSKKPKYIDKQALDQQGAYNKPFTRVLMFVAKGLIVTDATGTTPCNYSSGELCYIHKLNYKYKYISPTKAKIMYVADPAVISDANQRGMNIESDTVQTYAAA